jgi:hypothetical protein
MFGPVIQGLVKSSVKNVVNFELAIDPILQQFEKACPTNAEMKKIIVQKNQITQALTQVQTALTTISDTSSTLNNILTGIDIAIKIIKALPLPTSVPPGVGIPVSVINGFTSTLNTLGTIVKEGKGVTSVIAPALKIILDGITKINEKLASLDELLAKCLQEETKNMTEEEKAAYFEDLGVNLDALLSTSTEAAIAGNSLLESLSANSPTPLTYKNFKLVLDTDAANPFSFPRRRVLAYNITDSRIKLETPWSYSSSIEVLIDTAKFEIDKYINSNLSSITKLLPPSREIQPINDRGGNPILPTSVQPQTSIIREQTTSRPSPPQAPPSLIQQLVTQPDYAPFGVPGNYNGEVRTSPTGQPYTYNTSTRKWNP